VILRVIFALSILLHPLEKV